MKKSSPFSLEFAVAIAASAKIFTSWVSCCMMSFFFCFVFCCFIFGCVAFPFIE